MSFFIYKKIITFKQFFYNKFKQLFIKQIYFWTKQKLNQIVKAIEANKQNNFNLVNNDTSSDTTNNGTTNTSPASSSTNGTIRPFAGL